jgi:hypothetical protein
MSRTPNPRSRLRGELREFNLLEVLQMAQVGDMSGAIHLSQPPGHFGAVFLKQGKLAGCIEAGTGSLTLGQVLQQLGMATEQDVESVFAQQVQEAFGKRLGERLVARGVITTAQLHEALRTKALWTLRELGLWRQGTYELVVGQVDQGLLPYGEEPLDLEGSAIIMTMVAYASEWEQLAGPLPQGMQTALQPALALPPELLQDEGARHLLEGVRRYRTVRRTACGLRRLELDVARDLAALVQQGLVQRTADAATASEQQRGAGVLVWLREPGQLLLVESATLTTLIDRMLREWRMRRHTPEKQLVALALFVNWMLDFLSDLCRVRGVTLQPRLLEEVLEKGRLRYLGTYRFPVVDNRLSVDQFAALCREVRQHVPEREGEFVGEAWAVLTAILTSLFDLLNARVASLVERLENREAWETMLGQFSLQAGL